MSYFSLHQPPVLHAECFHASPSTWHDRLVTGHTLGRDLVAVAVVAQQGLVLAGEGLVRQRAVTAETTETVLVVVPVLVEQLLEIQQGQQSRSESELPSTTVVPLTKPLNP